MIRAKPDKFLKAVRAAAKIVADGKYRVTCKRWHGSQDSEVT